MCLASTLSYPRPVRVLKQAKGTEAHRMVGKKIVQDSVEQLADYCGVPVRNGLTTERHRTQMLGDILAVIEHYDGALEDITYCFVENGHSNVVRSTASGG
jgi:ornithine carbamoyltransferase